MGKIQSSTISASDAISELVDLDTSNAQNQQVACDAWAATVRHAARSVPSCDLP